MAKGIVTSPDTGRIEEFHWMQFETAVSAYFRGRFPGEETRGVWESADGAKTPSLGTKLAVYPDSTFSLVRSDDTGLVFLLHLSCHQDVS